MAFSQSDVDALKAAIATGARSVAYDGHSVTYRSMADMIATLRMMERDIATTSAAPFYPEFTRDGE